MIEAMEPPPPPPPPLLMHEHDMPKHGFLGIIMQMEREVILKDGKETETISDPSQGKGVYVSDVSPESAAAEAGLQAGDIITAINNQATPNPNALSDIIRQTKPNDKVTIAYLRNQMAATTQATLKARPPMQYDLHQNNDNNNQAKASCEPNPGCCKQANKARLGVMVETFDATLANEKGIKSTGGAYVMEVVEQSAAQKAGLQQGDIITQIAGKAVFSHRDVIAVLGEFDPNDNVKINYVRNGKKANTNAILQAATDNKNACHPPMHDQSHWQNNNIEQYLNGEAIEKMQERLHEQHEKWQEKKQEWDEKMERVREKGEEIRQRIIISDKGNNTNNEPQLIKKRIIVINGNDEIVTEDIEPLYIENISDIKNMTNINMTFIISVLDLETADQNVLKGVFEPPTTDNAKMLSDKTLRIDVSQYPNPTEGKFTLAFYAPETGNLNVRIADTMGKLVFNETLDNFSGQYQKELDLSANTKGTYFVQITQNGKSLSKKVIVE